MSGVNPRLVYWIKGLYARQELTAAHRDILIYLAVMRLDYGTGSGYCAVQSLAEGTGWHPATVKRALTIARQVDPPLLARTRRGHRISAENVTASEWQVLYPPMPTAQGNDVGNPTAHGGNLGTDPTSQSPQPNSALVHTQQRTGAPLTGFESPSGDESSSLSQPGHRELLAIDPDVTERETKEVLNLLTSRGARSPLAVLRREIADGNGYALIAEVRHQADRAEWARYVADDDGGGRGSWLPARMPCCGRAPGTGHLPHCPEAGAA